MTNRAEELITQLEAEIVKRDARIAELEAPMLAWSELDYTKHTRRSLMCYIGQQNFRITAQEKQLAALKANQPSSQEWPKQECPVTGSITDVDPSDMGAQQPSGRSHDSVGDWRIDTSAGREILVYKECSVIEGEDAHYILGLISAEFRAQQPSAVHLLFDGPPGPECGRFVEAEDASGRSINAGEWSQRPDGYWQLVIQRPCTGDLLAKIAELEQSVEVATTECVQQYRWRLEDSECGRDEINDGVDMLLARLKAQPSGVVGSDEVMQMAFEIGEPADDGSGYWFDLESFDEFIAAYTGRLNPCRAQAVPDGWVRVPVDPTPAMVSAYLAAQKAKAMASDMAWGVSDPAENFKAGFSAMIAAAIPAKKESE